MSTPLPTNLRVQADPEHAGKHPLHDSRFITAGPDDLTDEDWHLKGSTIVATMTDCERQADLAHAFAAAPDLLAALQKWDKFMRNNYDPHEISWWAETEAAIAKATGGTQP